MMRNWVIAVVVMSVFAPFSGGTCRRAFGADTNTTAADAAAPEEDDAEYRALRGEGPQQQGKQGRTGLPTLSRTTGATNTSSLGSSSRLQSDGKKSSASLGSTSNLGAAGSEKGSGPVFLVRLLQFDGNEEVKLLTGEEIRDLKHTLGLESLKVGEAYRAAEKEWQKQETTPFAFACPRPRKIGNVQRYADRQKAEEELTSQVNSSEKSRKKAEETLRKELDKMNPQQRAKSDLERGQAKKAMELFLAQLETVVQRLLEKEAEKSGKKAEAETSIGGVPLI